MGGAAGAIRVILLVEPNRNLASLMSGILGREGFSVLPANTFEEALELSKEVAGIDLLLTDVFLPGASGIDLAARVAQANPSVKTLYLSSVPERLLRGQGIAEEAAVMEKPIAISDLVARVGELLTS